MLKRVLTKIFVINIMLITKKNLCNYFERCYYQKDNKKRRYEKKFRKKGNNSGVGTI